MNPKVLRRFVIYLAAATVAMFTLWAVLDTSFQREPGDYYTEVGGNRLQEQNYAEALEAFDQALAERPDHRGALMGRALVFMQTERHDDALAEFAYLIAFLEKSLTPDDRTGFGTLAAAFANRGILNDRLGRYEQALADYIAALRVDPGALEGPGLLDRVVYGTPRPATVRKRAIYLKQQLALPPEKRLLRVPEIDEKQRMYKP
ncbi:MAG: tetratricopeptide repeat protein [Alphaproteobacteria bacterium]|jgi:tetratricopeptide (TPR) repeat protein|nr:hypothetical protein [Rhodospirillaceae bacterium]MDP6406696.1 tetratricopeptide repeat protein [Alphaproteobacteria bacterium]MDP6622841.1 tetratricopeptide repeat protein [Alphaproteobacteria bacterium]|tara:strand:+ start:131 stop:742 length:612 start_codon:yes stop_codon:yes gene_type:complete